MNKPATILIKEFDENICHIINSCGLPMWKVRDELTKVMQQVQDICLQEEEAELREYEKGLKKEELEKKRRERREEINQCQNTEKAIQGLTGKTKQSRPLMK